MHGKPLDVCLVCRYFYPVYTGAGERFRRYAPGLEVRGVKLRVVTVQSASIGPQPEIVDGVPIHRVPFSDTMAYTHQALLRETLRFFSTQRQWPDALHLLNHSIYGVPEIWKARRLGIPALYSVTMAPMQQPSLLLSLKSAIYQRIRFLPFDYILANSAVVRQGLQSRGIPNRRIRVIPNGVDVNRFRPVSSPHERAQIRQRLGLETDGMIVLFVGSISARKGVDLLLASWPDIVDRCPQARLVLVGPSSTHANSRRDASFLDKIDELIKSSPMPEHIILAGEVSNAEEYMRSANVFVFPSKIEGMPNVVLEAMATGLPCVLTPFVGLSSELGEPGRDFALVSHNPHDISAAVSSILAEEAMYQTLGKSARRWVEKHLDIERSLDSYAQLYREVVSKT